MMPATQHAAQYNFSQAVIMAGGHPAFDDRLWHQFFGTGAATPNLSPNPDETGGNAEETENAAVALALSACDDARAMLHQAEVYHDLHAVNDCEILLAQAHDCVRQAKQLHRGDSKVMLSAQIEAVKQAVCAEGPIISMESASQHPAHAKPREEPKEKLVHHHRSKPHETPIAVASFKLTPIAPMDLSTIPMPSIVIAPSVAAAPASPAPVQHAVEAAKQTVQDLSKTVTVDISVAVADGEAAWHEKGILKDDLQRRAGTAVTLVKKGLGDVVHGRTADAWATAKVIGNAIKRNVAESPSRFMASLHAIHNAGHNEYLRLLTPLGRELDPLMEKLKTHPKEFDINGDGNVEISEVIQVLHRYGIKDLMEIGGIGEITDSAIVAFVDARMPDALAPVDLGV